MHPSSIENMKRAFDQISPLPPASVVLDVGGARHSYKSVFEDHVAEYVVTDIANAPNVDFIMPGPFQIPFVAECYDLVVSGQMLEHCANPFRSVAEMTRVLKPGGKIILIAPSSGPRHDKQDGWRFMDDAFRFIAEDVGITTLADWITRDAPDERSRKWQDHVFIGEKPKGEGP